MYSQGATDLNMTPVLGAEAFGNIPFTTEVVTFIAHHRASHTVPQIKAQLHSFCSLRNQAGPQANGGLVSPQVGLREDRRKAATGNLKGNAITVTRCLQERFKVT